MSADAVVERADGADVLGRFSRNQALGGQLVVRAAEDRETPGHRRGLEAGLQECSLIELHVIGCDLEGSHPLRLHVPQEIHEIPDDKTFRMQE